MHLQIPCPVAKAVVKDRQPKVRREVEAVAAERYLRAKEVVVADLQKAGMPVVLALQWMVAVALKEHCDGWEAAAGKAVPMTA